MHCAEQGYFTWVGEGMEPLSVAAVTKIASSEYVWTILFILLAGFVLKKMYEKNEQLSKRAEEREDKLMTHLERSNKSQEKTAVALEGINRSLTSLEGRVDRMEKYTYKHGDE